MPLPAKLVVGAFTARKSLLDAVLAPLQKELGGIDLVSAWWAFDYTDYYTAEMGQPLFRRMLAFKSLVDAGQLATLKAATNRMEVELSLGQRRQVNLDPGILTRERFVLATGKNFVHRVYLRDGIYADLTLLYQRGAFEPLPWTYPDYRSPEMLAFLERVRAKYGEDLCAQSFNVQGSTLEVDGFGMGANQPRSHDQH